MADRQERNPVYLLFFVRRVAAVSGGAGAFPAVSFEGAAIRREASAFVAYHGVTVCVFVGLRNLTRQVWAVPYVVSTEEFPQFEVFHMRMDCIFRLPDFAYVVGTHLHAHGLYSGHAVLARPRIGYSIRARVGCYPSSR